MYRRIVAALAATDAAKYDDDHNLGSLERRCGNPSRRMREEKPLNCFETNDAKSFGWCLANT